METNHNSGSLSENSLACQTLSTHAGGASESQSALEIIPQTQTHDRALAWACSLHRDVEELIPWCIPSPQCVIKTAAPSFISALLISSDQLPLLNAASTFMKTGIAAYSSLLFLPVFKTSPRVGFTG